MHREEFFEHADYGDYRTIIWFGRLDADDLPTDYEHSGVVRQAIAREALIYLVTDNGTLKIPYGAIEAVY